MCILLHSIIPRQNDKKANPKRKKLMFLSVLGPCSQMSWKFFYFINRMWFKRIYCRLVSPLRQWCVDLILIETYSKEIYSYLCFLPSKEKVRLTQVSSNNLYLSFSSSFVFFLYLSPTFPHFAHPHPLTSGHHQPLLCKYEVFVLHVLIINYTNKMIQCKEMRNL